MAKRLSKFYVVWEGLTPGIYDNWNECKQQIDNYTGAKYKSFLTKDDAIEAYRNSYSDAFKNNLPTKNTTSHKINPNSICVDAACSGNPGIMEYRGVDYQSKEILFHHGPFADATNNIGEFLALVNALTYLKKNNSNKIIYTDSITAISWVRKKEIKSNLIPNAKNIKVFEWMNKALQWIKTNDFSTTIVKWDTENWGEIPADFGRK